MHTTPRISRSIIIALSAVVGLLVGLNHKASAAGLDSGPSVIVKYHGLNLDSPAGAALLYKRIHDAAWSVCSSGATEDLSRQPAHQACAQRAEARAILAVGSSALTTYYQDKTGRLIATFAAN